MMLTGLSKKIIIGGRSFDCIDYHGDIRIKCNPSDVKYINSLAFSSERVLVGINNRLNMCIIVTKGTTIISEGVTMEIQLIEQPQQTLG